MFAKSNTLYTNSKRIQISLSDASRAHDTNGFNPTINEQQKRGDDGTGEYPPRYIDGNFRLDLTRPLVEGEKIDGSEGVDGVHCDWNESQHPNHQIWKASETGAAFEIIEILSHKW